MTLNLYFLYLSIYDINSKKLQNSLLTDTVNVQFHSILLYKTTDNQFSLFETKAPFRRAILLRPIPKAIKNNNKDMEV